MTNKELWPFKPVYDELKIRLAGIEDECEPLGLELNLRNETEEEMFVRIPVMVNTDSGFIVNT